MTETYNELKNRALEKYFDNLNDRQRKAVFKVDGPLLILAGAGSGKTTVLINRIANMIHFGHAYSFPEGFGMPSEEDMQFLRRYADLSTVITDAVGQYITDVKSKDFPSLEESY